MKSKEFRGKPMIINFPLKLDWFIIKFLLFLNLNYTLDIILGI
jgi:hypothetical protein